jgi:rod shape-determining protein MreC
MEHSPPPFFNRGPAPVVRLTFFALLSVFLMVIDARFRYTEPLRQVLITVAYPVQRAVLAPVEAAARIGDYFQSLSDLQKDNADLRAEKLKAAKDLMTLEALQAENAQLRGLLDARERAKSEAVFAEIVYGSRDPFARRVVIDKGFTQGVELGRPVIDAAGVLGQVTRVTPLASEVTLITHKDHAIPVQVVRNGLRAVAYGSSEGVAMELRHLAANAEVQPGDELVTSGIDGVYPAGLPVGKVVRVDRDAAFSFARILVAPVAGTDQHRQVLVLRLAEEAPPYPAAEEPAKKAAKSKRAKRGTP